MILSGKTSGGKQCSFVFFSFALFLKLSIFILVVGLYFRDFIQGLSCKVLNVRSLHFHKLNIVGEFAQLHTLILDKNRLLGFGEGCFSCMPNLTYLSMCDTLVSDLWTTTAALLKLPSLKELRFQIWICCSDSSPLKSQSSSSSSTREDENTIKESSSPIGADDVFEHMDTDLPVEETLHSMDFSYEIPEQDDLDSCNSVSAELNGGVFMRKKVKKHVTIHFFLFVSQPMRQNSAMVKASPYHFGRFGKGRWRTNPTMFHLLVHLPDNLGMLD